MYTSVLVKLLLLLFSAGTHASTTASSSEPSSTKSTVFGLLKWIKREVKVIHVDEKALQIKVENIEEGQQTMQSNIGNVVVGQRRVESNIAKMNSTVVGMKKVLDTMKNDFEKKEGKMQDTVTEIKRDVDSVSKDVATMKTSGKELGKDVATMKESLLNGFGNITYIGNGQPSSYNNTMTYLYCTGFEECVRVCYSLKKKDHQWSEFVYYSSRISTYKSCYCYKNPKGHDETSTQLHYQFN